MSHRSNGGIYGPQNRSTPTLSSGIWHLYDEQQSIQARNWFGTLPAVPNSPTVTSQTLATNTSASIGWYQGFNGGSTVTKITVTAVPGGQSTVVNSPAASGTTTVSGLAPGITYVFNVVATNSAGDSLPGVSAPLTTPGVPAAPTIGTVTFANGQASIPFTPNSDGGSTITSYTVASSVGGFSVTGASSPLIIPQLTAATSFTFTVYATNAIGNGPASSASNSITTPNGATGAYLSVAGGGGGGTTSGGGGGAGGALTAASYIYYSGSVYTITVGGAGTGSTSTAASGTNGGDSKIAISSVTVANCLGGGGGGSGSGGSGSVATGQNGGSGGGGSYSYPPITVQNGGTGTSGQGYAGAIGLGSGYIEGGGGGGASAAGSIGSGITGGAGGNGISSSITGSAVSYGGGGGGGSGANGGGSAGIGGAGGSGGGGAGTGNSSTGGAGTIYTGGGGGGGGYQGGYGAGGNGGAGVVILSIPTAKYTSTYTGSPTITTSGGDTILKFTGNGSYTA